MSEIKCKNCVFCSEKQEYMKTLPNDFVCGSIKSKWRGFWPPNGECDRYAEPTGIKVKDVINEGTKNIINNFLNALSVFEIDKNEIIEKFYESDSAILKDYIDDGEGCG